MVLLHSLHFAKVSAAVEKHRELKRKQTALIDKTPIVKYLRLQVSLSNNHNYYFSFINHIVIYIYIKVKIV